MKKSTQPKKKTPLEQASEAAARFIYGGYEITEIANGKDTVTYTCGGEPRLLQ